MPLGREVWKLCLCLIWGTWWGGLCFYAVVVVQIGSSAIGNVAQGFITQQVTRWHNGLSILFLVCLLLEAYRSRSRVLGVAALLLAVIDIALLVWHARLTSMLNFADQLVPGSFYGEHAIYLWTTAVEWMLGVAIPFWLLCECHACEVLRSASDAKPS